MAEDRDIDRLDRRIDSVETSIRTLDEHGSQGMVGLQVQVAQLIKDVAQVEPAIDKLRAEMKNQFTLHEASHQASETKRSNKIRWLVATALTLGGLFGGVIGHVVEKVSYASQTTKPHGKIETKGAPARGNARGLTGPNEEARCPQSTTPPNRPSMGASFSSARRWCSRPTRPSRPSSPTTAPRTTSKRPLPWTI